MILNLLEVDVFYDLARTQYYLSIHFFVSEVALLVRCRLWTHLIFWEIIFPLHNFIIRRMDEKDLVFLNTEFLLFVPELYFL